MQTKNYENLERQVVPANGQGTISFQNVEKRKENFHGIRFKGRIIVDDANLGLSSGFIYLLCLPTSAQPTPIMTSSALMDDNNAFLIAIEPFMVLNENAGGNVNAQFGSVHDWNFEIRTSRTCNEGGRIVAVVHNDSSSTNSIIVNMLLSCFRTIT